MAVTQVLTSDPLTLKLWETTAWIQTMQKSHMGHLFNRGAIYVPEKLMSANSRGDSLTFPYIGKMKGVPVGEGGTLVNNEKALDMRAHSMIINESRDAIKFPATGIEQQRLGFDMDKVIEELLPSRAVELVDTSIFQQLAGVNPNTITMDGTTYSTTAEKLHVQGHNIPVAPSVNRIMRPNGVTADQNLSSTDRMSLPLIDYAMEQNDAADQPIEPFDDGTFDLYLSPAQLTQLKLDTTSAITWRSIAGNMAAGGDKKAYSNRFMNGMVSVGTYANVNLYSNRRVAYGINSTNSAPISTVRRAVLVGKNALSYASPYGGRPTDTDVPMKIINQLEDYGKYKGIGFEMVYGLKKMAPTNYEDIGSLVISTYAAQNY